MEREIRRLARAAVIVAACGIVTAPAPCFGQGARETWQPPEKIMDAIGVRPGMRVGEAGAGQGYFTFPLARRVGPEGVVFANDISTSSLDVIRERAVREGPGNIKIVVGEVENPRFSERNLDMIVMVYVLHHLERPIPFVKNLHPYLRPEGSLVIIEGNNTAERGHFPPFMTSRQILGIMSETGYELDRTETFLPRDTIYVYKAKRAGKIHGAVAAGDLNKVSRPTRATRRSPRATANRSSRTWASGCTGTESPRFAPATAGRMATAPPDGMTRAWMWCSSTRAFSTSPWSAASTG